jgi:hypothetical protein
MTLQTDAAPVTPMPRRRGATRAVVIGIAVVLTCGLVAGLWHWRSSPDVFLSGGSGIGDDSFAVGQTVYMGLSPEREGLHGEIQIRSIEPDIRRDDAAARVEYFICTVDPHSGLGGIGFVGESDVQQVCDSFVPADDQTMTLNASAPQQLVMAATGTRPGVTHVGGTAISYGYGWQTGTQFLADELRLTAVR